MGRRGMHIRYWEGGRAGRKETTRDIKIYFGG
jgi:hypothetical protein